MEDIRVNLLQAILMASQIYEEFTKIADRYLKSKGVEGRVKRMYFDIEEEPPAIIIYFVHENGRIVRWTFRIEVD